MPQRCCKVSVRGTWLVRTRNRHRPSSRSSSSRLWSAKMPPWWIHQRASPPRIHPRPRHRRRRRRGLDAARSIPSVCPMPRCAATCGPRCNTPRTGKAWRLFCVTNPIRGIIIRTTTTTTTMYRRSVRMVCLGGLFPTHAMAALVTGDMKVKFQVQMVEACL
jgi:hypothetical protein